MEYTLNDYLDISEEVAAAVTEGKPVVALESTILSHGMPWPDNLEFGKKVEAVIREAGAIPATMAVINGRMKAGLSESDLELLCKNEGNVVKKLSRRDLPIALATGATGATTVTTTMMLAHLAGVKFFATGGIGGVHRGAEKTMDISADLQELAQTPVAVICAGAKMILDIDLTLEYLETQGVPVLGYKTDDFPSFYCRKSGFGVDYKAEKPLDVAKLAKVKWDLGFKGGILIGNPVPEEYALDFDKMTAVINEALDEANAKQIHGKETTPFLLAKIVELTGGDSLATNIQLALNNARVAAEIAVAYAEL